MGACFSTPAHLLEVVDGDEGAYKQRFREDKFLGEGDFGKVKLVLDTTAPDDAPPLASKALHKGSFFKNNVLVPPVDPKVLKAETEILRTLSHDDKNQKYCLKLHFVYETSKIIYLVTECCLGLHLNEFIAQQQSTAEGMETADASRIAFQLLSAVHHMAQHKIMHRDIKPDNCMFVSKDPGSDLRLIDFGSGCIDNKPNQTLEADGMVKHKTFAGTAFYNSPEKLNLAYNLKSDVWSVGVCLYVVLAGYPAKDRMQKAYSLLQKVDRDLRQLPGMPLDVHDSCVDLMAQALTYRHKQRPMAGQLLQHEFLQLHQREAKEQPREKDNDNDDDDKATAE